MSTCIILLCKILPFIIFDDFRYDSRMLVLGFVHKALYIEGILYGAMFSDCELMKFLCSGIKVYAGSQTSPLSEKNLENQEKKIKI